MTASLRPQSAEQPVCSGPFSDARDCPVHSRDVTTQSAKLSAEQFIRRFPKRVGTSVLYSESEVIELLEAYARAAAPQIVDRQPLKCVSCGRTDLEHECPHEGTIRWHFTPVATLPVGESRQREIQSTLEVGAITEEEAKRAAAPAAPLPCHTCGTILDPNWLNCPRCEGKARSTPVEKSTLDTTTNEV